MTDRHIHCVYFKYDKINDVNGKCLLKNKDIDFGYYPHCEDAVLVPSLILSYFLKIEGYCDNWFDADEKALEFLEKMKLNRYPKESENNG